MGNVLTERGEGRVNGPRPKVARNRAAGAGKPYAGNGSPSIPLMAAKGTTRRTVIAHGPGGAFLATGQVAKALEALTAAAAGGVTALETAGWGYRLAAYVFTLRRGHGLDIETVREEHADGWHARYVLHSPVTLVRAA